MNRVERSKPLKHMIFIQNENTTNICCKSVRLMLFSFRDQFWNVRLRLGKCHGICSVEMQQRDVNCLRANELVNIGNGFRISEGRGSILNLNHLYVVHCTRNTTATVTIPLVESSVWLQLQEIPETSSENLRGSREHRLRTTGLEAWVIVGISWRHW